MITEFFNLLYQKDETIEFRPIKPEWKGGGAGQSEFIKFNGNISSKITDLIQRKNKKYNLYFGVIPRIETGEKSKVARVNACFFDMDKKDFSSEEEFNRHIQTLENEILPSVKLEYTAKIDSGHGFHYYFILHPEEKLPIENNTCDAWREIQCALIDLCKADQAVGKDLPRIMRIPGSKNIKEQGNFKDCKILDFHKENVYRYSDFLTLLKKYKEETEKKIIPVNKSIHLCDNDIINICSNAKNGEKFDLLFKEGDITKYPSHSEADLALVELLLFYTQDREQIDAIFRKSALMREKWNRDDYRERTIDKALAGQTEFYNPDYKFIEGKEDVKSCKSKKNDVFLKAKKFLNSKYELKRNVITQKIEILIKETGEMKELDDPFLSRIYFELHKNNMGLNKQDLQLLLINPDFVKEYDPLKDFIDNIPDPQDMDYIKTFTDCITLSNEKERSLFQKTFKKWFVGIMTGVYPNNFCNHLMFILIGKQGIGKTRVLNYLIPIELKNYLQEQGVLKEDDKDVKISVSTHLLLNIDELESFRKKDVDSLKSLITAKHFDLRMPYDHFSRKLKKRASFMGSTNKDNFLSDPTGARRFLIFEIDFINFNKINNELIKNMYWQARKLYKSGGFKFHLTQEIIEKLNCRNERFAQEDLVKELVIKYLEPAKEFKNEDGIELMTCSEITAYLLEEANLGDSSLNNRDWTIRKLGIHLKSGGFIRKCNKGLYKYAVRKKIIEDKAEEESLDF